MTLHTLGRRGRYGVILAVGFACVVPAATVAAVQDGVSTNAAAGLRVYRSVDAQGRVMFSDQPQMGAVQTDTIRLVVPPPDSAPEVHERRMAMRVTTARIEVDRRAREATRAPAPPQPPAPVHAFGPEPRVMVFYPLRPGVHGRRGRGWAGPHDPYRRGPPPHAWGPYRPGGAIDQHPQWRAGDYRAPNPYSMIRSRYPASVRQAFER
jgi:hypothetical protein